jgi:hypothetical protein
MASIRGIHECPQLAYPDKVNDHKKFPIVVVPVQFVSTCSNYCLWPKQGPTMEYPWQTEFQFTNDGYMPLKEDNVHYFQEMTVQSFKVHGTASKPTYNFLIYK